MNHVGGDTRHGACALSAVTAPLQVVYYSLKCKRCNKFYSTNPQERERVPFSLGLSRPRKEGMSSRRKKPVPASPREG